MNRLIIARLPLALPPFAPNCTPYYLGLQAFANIFTTFEDAWDGHTATRKPAQVPDDLHDVLSALLPDQLRRTRVLHEDLAYLSKHVQPSGFSETTADPLSVTSIPMALQTQSFTSHISHAIAAKPHLIVAYTWVMYMALFSGGRYIRAQLRLAGPRFWSAASELELKEKDGGQKDLPPHPGYSFLNFSGSRDGEDIKAAFKHQLAHVDGLLSQQQRREIVAEARDLFSRCVDVVRELDTLCGTPPEMLALEQAAKKTQNDAMVSPTDSSMFSLQFAKSYTARNRHASILLSALLCILMLLFRTCGTNISSSFELDMPIAPT